MVLAWTPPGDIILQNIYKIINATSISTKNMTAERIVVTQSANIQANLSINNNYICLDDPINCSAYMRYNGTGIIIHS